MNNIKEIKSTLIGFMLFLAGFVIIIYEYLTVATLEVFHYALPLGFLVSGILLLFASDKFIDAVIEILKKRFAK